VLTPVVLAVAHTFYRTVDLNSIKLSKWIANKLTKAKQAVQKEDKLRGGSLWGVRQ
jgi:hypothetical protein